MEVRRIADAELERAVQIVRKRGGPGDTAHLTRASDAARLADVDGQGVGCAPRHDLERVGGRPARFVRNHRNGRAGCHLSEVGEAEQGLLHDVDPGLSERIHGSPRTRSAAVAPIRVEPEEHLVSDLVAQAADETGVALCVASALDLQRADAVCDCRQAFGDGFVVFGQPEHVRDRNLLARQASEESMNGNAVRMTDEVVQRDVEKRLRVRISDHDLVEAGRDFSERERALGERRREVLVDDRRDRRRGLTVSPPIGVAPVAQSDHLAPALEAVGLDACEHELAERPRQGQPAEVGAGWKPHDDRLDPVDRDQHQALSSMVSTRLPCSSTTSVAYGGTNVVESAW